MTASTVDRTSEAVAQLIDALDALAAARVAAEVERLAPQLVTRVTEQLAAQQVATSLPAVPVEPWLSVPEAARRAERHVQTIREALREYERSNHRRGLRGSQPMPAGRWRIRPADLDAWLAGESPKRRKP